MKKLFEEECQFCGRKFTGLTKKQVTYWKNSHELSCPKRTEVK